MSQLSAPGTAITCSVHHQHSGKISPFNAETVERCVRLSHTCGRVVRGAEDIASAPTDARAHGSQGLDHHTRLSRHAQQAVKVQALDWLVWGSVLLAVHETKHLVLNHAQHLAAELGEAHVLNF